MKILLLHSSAKGEKSRSLRVARSFVEGLLENKKIEEVEVSEVWLFDKEIKDCISCNHCWKDTSMKCFQRDDMDLLLPEYFNADMVIWCFPLLFYGIPSRMKVFVERLLPLFHYEMKERPDGGYYHPTKYPMKERREVFISTCAFPSEVNNYEAVREMVRIMFGELADCIFCPESSIFDAKKVENLVGRYLKAVKESAKSYSIESGIEEYWVKRLSTPILPEDLYMDHANHDTSWIDY